MKSPLTGLRDTDKQMPRLVNPTKAPEASEVSNVLSPEAAWQAYLQNFAVAHTVDMIARLVADVTPTVIAEDVGVDVSPVCDIISFPGLNRSRMQMVREIVTRMLVTGTAYVIFTGRHDRPPLAIDVLDTLRVRANFGPDGWPTSYTVGPDPGWIFSRRVFTRSNLGYVNTGVGELLPIYEMAGSPNGIGLSRLCALWSILASTNRREHDNGLIATVRRRFEVPAAYEAGSDTISAAAASAALHHDVILPLFAAVYGTLARSFSERCNADIRIVPAVSLERTAPSQTRAEDPPV